MKLIIVRHAEPDYSIDSLTEKGFKEAEFLAQRLKKIKIDDVYVSRLGRAQDTARPYLKATGKTAEVCDWLVEFEGYILDPETNQRRIPWDFMPSYWTKNDGLFDKKLWLAQDVLKTGDVEKKYSWVIENLDNTLKKYGYERSGNMYNVTRVCDDTVVFFCHFGVECVLLSHILNISPIVLWQGFIALPSSVTTLISEERENGKAYFRCNGFGDISHLYANDEDPSFAGRFCELFSNEDERH